MRVFSCLDNRYGVFQCMQYIFLRGNVFGQIKLYFLPVLRFFFSLTCLLISPQEIGGDERGLR